MSDSIPKSHVTWDMYQAFPDDERWEIIDGVPYSMSSPSLHHQTLVGNLHVMLRERFKGKPCRVLLSPFDVKLSEQDIVQPDLLVVCVESKLRKGHVDGPPDLVIEVISPGSERQDRVRKLNLYAKAGVREYWIFHPVPPLAEVLS